jgi:hypothetical protein
MSTFNLPSVDPWQDFLNKFRRENPVFALGSNGKADFVQPDGQFCTEANRCLASSDVKDKVKVIEMCVAFFEKLRIFSEQAAMRPAVQVWAGESTLSEIEKKFLCRDLGCFLDSSVIQELIQELDASPRGFEEKIADVIQDVKDRRRWAERNANAIITHLKELNNLCKLMNEWYKKFRKTEERLCNVVKKLPSNVYVTKLVGHDLIRELIGLINRDLDVLSGGGARSGINDHVVKILVGAVKFLQNSGKMRFDMKMLLKEIKKRFVDIKSISTVSVCLDDLYCGALAGGKYNEIFNGLESLTQ